MNTDKTFEITARLLRTVSYFSNMDDATLWQISQTALCRVYLAGQLILLEGEPSAGLYILESGWLKAFKMGVDGREQVLQTLGPGEVFNAISVFTDVPNQASVTALETSRVWMVGREVLLDMMDNHPGLARLVVRDLAGRVAYLVRMIEDLSLRSVEARLARLLLELAEDGVVRRRRWATQGEIAARLGTVSNVVNRAFLKLAEAGMIEFDRQQIRILDKDGLSVTAQMIE